MKKLLAVIAGAGLSGALYAGEPVDKRVEADPAGEVRIDVTRGNVKVEAWDENAVHVTGTRDRKSEQFLVERAGRNVLIEDELSGYSRGSDEEGTHITVRVPRGSAVEMDTISAEQHVTGVQGGVRVESISGVITTVNTGRELRASTVSGDITATGARGEVQLETVSGDINADVEAKRLEMETVSGDVTVRNTGVAERVEASVISGDLEFSTALATDGRAILESVSGDLTMTLRGNIDANFYLETGPGGDIENRLTDQLPSRERYTGAEFLELRIGQGSADVEAAVISGRITMARE